MDEHEALETARNAVKVATASGASQVEATISVTQRFNVEARDKTLAKLEQSTGKILHVRIFADGRRVSLTTSDFSTEGLRDAMVRAIDQSAFIAVDPLAGLPESCSSSPGDLALFDPAVAQRDGEAKVDDALTLERLIRDADARIVNSSGSNYSDSVSITALANSGGFGGSYTTTRASRFTGPVAQDGDVKRTAHYGTSSRRLADLESNEVTAATAARRTVEMFGARKPATMHVPVVFERDVAASILDDLFSALNAANVAVGNSWLSGRVGEKIGSDLVEIFDDGTLQGALGSSPFDGEGVATRATTVFERGVLRTFLYDTYYARKLGAATTANSNGSGIGPNNFYLKPGAQSLQELIAGIPKGVLVLDTIGFATEYATGTYSRGARGFYIENGSLAYPIDEFTVAGTYASMLGSIDAVGNDLRFDAPTVSPSFRVAEMTISGN